MNILDNPNFEAFLEDNFHEQIVLQKSLTIHGSLKQAVKEWKESCFYDKYEDEQ